MHRRRAGRLLAGHRDVHPRPRRARAPAHHGDRVHRHDHHVRRPRATPGRRPGRGVRGHVHGRAQRPGYAAADRDGRSRPLPATRPSHHPSGRPGPHVGPGRPASCRRRTSGNEPSPNRIRAARARPARPRSSGHRRLRRGGRPDAGEQRGAATAGRGTGSATRPRRTGAACAGRRCAGIRRRPPRPVRTCAGRGPARRRSAATPRPPRLRRAARRGTPAGAARRRPGSGRPGARPGRPAPRGRARPRRTSSSRWRMPVRIASG